MATLDVKTIGGSPNSAVVDANYDSWLAVVLDNSRAGHGVSPVNYNLTGTTAGLDIVYGVLGSKASSTESRAEDTIIRGGVVPIQFSTAYVRATHQGLRVVSSTTRGVVSHTTTDGIGRGRIIDGGTLNVKGTTVNVVYVDVDAN
jgi:hypothetical protein